MPSQRQTAFVLCNTSHEAIGRAADTVPPADVSMHHRPSFSAPTTSFDERGLTIGASPGVVVFVSLMMLAMLYAFVCQLREERIARAAVKRARAAYPEVWQRLGWVYRTVMNPTFTIRTLSNRHGVSDPEFDAQLDEVRSLARRKLA